MSGHTSPSKKKGSSIGWPLIILLFALGLSPIAFVLLIVKLVEDNKAKTARQTASRSAANRGDSVDARVEDAVARAMASVKTEQKRSASGKGKKDRQKKIPSGVLLRIIGIFSVFCGSVISLSSLIDMVDYYSSHMLEDLLVGLCFTVVGGILWGRGQYLAETKRRSRRYQMAIGSAEAMSLEEIALRVNRTPQQAAKELQKLIDKGYFAQDSYVDRSRGYFLRFGASPAPAPRETAVPKEEPSEPSYESILLGFRRANDRIAGVELSGKIDRLEQISRLIFREVEAHPEKRESIRTFFDYYLPTTQKLLDAYADFEETGADGEHLREAKERIEQTMDAIVEGFAHQLNLLFSDEAIDVVSDIKVMEAMLHRDTASVAKDFGYSPECEHAAKQQAETM